MANLFLQLFTLAVISCMSWTGLYAQYITRPPETHRPVEANGLLYNLYYVPPDCMDPVVMSKIDFSGGQIIKDRRVIMKEHGPYTVEGNIEVAPSACLVIMPGAQMFFSPGVGIIVNGTLIARGSKEERITMTKRDDSNVESSSAWPRDARLVDGNTTKDGRLDLFHQGKWRGVCTNYHNFSAIDLNVTCRHLGFVYGNFTYHSFARNETDYMLYEKPGCTGSENNLFECPGSGSIRYGDHICDGQQLIGFECAGLRPDLARDYWRGLEFYNTTTTPILSENVYNNETQSYLEYLDVSYAGLDTFAGDGLRHGRASISASPYVPMMNNVTVRNGAYDALNLTEIRGRVHIANSSISDNRGHGVYLKTAVGRTLINVTNIRGNWADGIKMYMANYTIHEFTKDFPSELSFCRTPSLRNPVFPILEYQDVLDPLGDKVMGFRCSKSYSTKPGKMMTLHILIMERDPEASGTITVRDSGEKILEFPVNNGSFPGSVTTRTSLLSVEFTYSLPRAQPGEDKTKRCKHMQSCIRFLMEITTNEGPDTELRLYESDVSNNIGYGVNVQDIRSKIHINSSVINDNGYGAGLRVYQGAGEIAVNNTVIRRNTRCGVNITYCGGYQLFNLTTVSENRGYGVITEYLKLNRTRFEVMQKIEVVGSTFSLNEWTAFRIGNYCRGGEYLVNESYFFNNLHETIEYLSCNLSTTIKSTNFSMAYNTFANNGRHAVLMSPLVNSVGIFTNNTFREHRLGVIRIDNGYDFVESRWYSKLEVNYRMFENIFENNYGRYCVNIRLTQNSPFQQLDFKYNKLVDNDIKDSFMYLNPRSRANAVIIASSGNVKIQRNHIYNPDSVRDLATHLVDPSVTIMADRNWWQTTNHALVYRRIFDQDDRYNLAEFHYHPVLKEKWLYGNYDTGDEPQYRWDFARGSVIGGVLDGTFRTDPRIRTYHVDKDIFILKDSTLIVLPGTTFEFESSIGMVVHGRLEVDGAKARPPQPIVFKLAEDNVVPLVNRTTYEWVRLVDGLDEFEGRLEVNISGEWGTICNKGWTDANAALVCHQLGLSYHPAYSEAEQKTSSLDGKIWMSRVECNELDTDIRKCKAEFEGNFVCDHTQDVFMRCQSPTWSGVAIPASPRFGTTFETQIRHLVIDSAGLLDFQDMTYAPGLQIDYNFYSISHLTVKNCMSDGVHIKYSNPYSDNLIEHLNLENNLGNGLLTRSPFLRLQHLYVDHNRKAGLMYDPFFTEYEALSVRNFIYRDRAKLITEHTSMDIGNNAMIFVTCPTGDGPESQTYYREYRATSSSFRLVVQILDYNPLTAVEKVTVYDGPRSSIDQSSKNWEIEEDLVDFPVVSTTTFITVKFVVNGVRSGRLAFTVISRGYRDSQITSKISVFNATIQNNERGIVTKHYNNPSNERMEIFHRAKAEEIRFDSMLVQNNRKEAMFIPSLTKYHEKLIPTFEEMTQPEKVGAITYVITQAKFLNNDKGIHGEHNHVDFANNVWKWHVSYTQIVGCNRGGFEIELPRVNDLKERQIHEVYITESKLHNNDDFAFAVNGYYANVSIANNVFYDNKCKQGLVTMTGMQKGLNIVNNRMERNYGKYVINLDLKSHAEYNSQNVGGLFRYNVIIENQHSFVSTDMATTNTPVTYTLAVQGVQKMIVIRNVFDNPRLQYELVAGITSLSIENKLSVEENYWGTTDQYQIRKRIFDFDDWNNYAIADYFPYLTIPNAKSQLTTDSEVKTRLDLDKLGGRIWQDLSLPLRSTPYIVYSDLTVMPGVTFTLEPGTELQFYPNVGILVLGKLLATGSPFSRIKMGPVSTADASVQPTVDYSTVSNTIRLHGGLEDGEGFLQLYNSSSRSWNLMCDSQFNEKTAEVVCRELGYETINAKVTFTHLFDYYVYGMPQYFLKEFWEFAYYCRGDEESLDFCMKRINYHIKPCIFAANYTFIRCGKRNLPHGLEYWGNIRFAASSFEENVGQFVRDEDRSRLEYVDIYGAGILHGEKVGAVQTTYVSPIINHVNITNSVSNGLDIIAPRHHVDVKKMNISDNLGYAVNVLVLNGDSKVSDQSSFIPLVTNTVPYNLYGLVEICRMEKDIVLQNRMILFFKYSQAPVDCVKVVNGMTSVGPKKVALRFLQFSLYHDEFYRNAIEIYDGPYITGDNRLAELMANSSETAIKQKYTSSQHTLTIHIHASPSYGFYGFIAEVVTLPVSGLTYPDSSYIHTLEHVVMTGNQNGALLYKNVGEITPSLVMDHCWIENNGFAMLNLTSPPIIDIGLQSTQVFNMGHTFVSMNKGGMHVNALTPSVATKLRSNITNNVFSSGTNGEVLKLTGHYFEKFMVRENYIFNNTAGDYRNIIHVQGVVVNFTFNLITKNTGDHILEAFNTESTEATQLYQKNYLHDNNATAVHRATISVVTGNPKINDNYLVNEECDFEIRSRLKQSPRPGLPSSSVPIDASDNWWGSTSTGYINGKIWDQHDNDSFAPVQFEPFRIGNDSLIYGKCAPGWIEDSNRCYKYMGAALPYYHADWYCKDNEGFLAEAKGREKFFKYLLYLTDNSYDESMRVWVYADVAGGRCSAFENDYIVPEDDCYYTLHPFICEKDPYISPPGPGAFMLVAIICGAVFGFALIVILILGIMWRIKSKRRTEERIERASTIRSSIHGSVISRSTLSVNALRAGRSKQRLDSLSSSRYGLDNRSLNASMVSLGNQAVSDEEDDPEWEERQVRKKLRERAEWARENQENNRHRQNGGLRRGRINRSREDVESIDDEEGSVSSTQERLERKRRELENDSDDDVDEKTRLFARDTDASSFDKTKYRIESERDDIPMKRFDGRKDGSGSERSGSSSVASGDKAKSPLLPLNIPTTPVKPEKPVKPVKPLIGIKPVKPAVSHPVPAPRIPATRPVPAARSRENLAADPEDTKMNDLNEEKRDHFRGSSERLDGNAPEQRIPDAVNMPEQPPVTFYGGARVPSEENLFPPPPSPVFESSGVGYGSGSREDVSGVGIGSGVDYLPRDRTPSQFDYDDTDRSEIDTPLLQKSATDTAISSTPLRSVSSENLLQDGIGSSGRGNMYKKNAKKSRSRDNLYEKRANELKKGSKENILEDLVHGRKKSRSKENLAKSRSKSRSREKLNSSSSYTDYGQDTPDNTGIDYLPRRPSDPFMAGSAGYQSTPTSRYNEPATGNQASPYAVSPPPPPYTRNQSADESASGVDFLPRKVNQPLQPKTRSRSRDKLHSENSSMSEESNMERNDLKKPEKKKSIETVI